MNNYLVYLAHGSTDILNECVYSILSFYQTNPNSDSLIIIYTDAKPYIQSYLGNRVWYREINQGEINLWKGKSKFVHRVKIKILQDFISSHKGNVLYVDTDTMFCSDISHIYRNIADDKRYFSTIHFFLLNGDIELDRNWQLLV